MGGGTELPNPLKISEVAGYIEKIESGKAIRIIVTAPDYEGQELTATKGSQTNKATVKDGTATITVPEGGIWTVSANDGTQAEIEIDVQYDWPVELAGTIGHHFGIRVTKAESDPQKRITPLEDLVGLKPVTVNQNTGEVDYGDMDRTFLFEAMNHVVAMKIDQSEEIELDPNDYSKKLNGDDFSGATDNLNNPASLYNIFARVDKLYSYWYDDSLYEYYYVADYKVDSNYEPLGFYNASSENDYMYTGVSLGYLDSSTRLRSIGGQKISATRSPADFLTYAQKNGKDYSYTSHAENTFYAVAYLMMFQSYYMANVFGKGRRVDAVTNTVYDTNNETGYSYKEGPISYDLKSNGVKFMHVEDFWMLDNELNILGAIGVNNKLYIKMRPPYSATSTSGYTELSDLPATKSGYIKSSKVSNKLGMIPWVFGGSSSTFETARSQGLCSQFSGFEQCHFCDNLFGLSLDGAAFASQSHHARLHLIPSK